MNNNRNNNKNENSNNVDGDEEEKCMVDCIVTRRWLDTVRQTPRPKKHVRGRKHVRMSTCPVFSFGKNAHSDRADNEATDDARRCCANRCARDIMRCRRIIIAEGNTHDGGNERKRNVELSASTRSSHWIHNGTRNTGSEAIRRPRGLHDDDDDDDETTNARET